MAKKISELSDLTYGETNKQDRLLVVNYDTNGNPLATNKIDLETLARSQIVQLDVDVANIASNSVVSDGPIFGVTTDGKLAYLEDTNSSFSNFYLQVLAEQVRRLPMLLLMWKSALSTYKTLLQLEPIYNNLLSCFYLKFIILLSLTPLLILLAGSNSLKVSNSFHHYCKL